MPKSSDRTSHFEQLSSDNLNKYIQGTPISVMTGRSIKYGSHEHKYQMAAIKKIILKRRADAMRKGDSVSFDDAESRSAAPRKRVEKRQVSMHGVQHEHEEKEKVKKEAHPVESYGYMKPQRSESPPKRKYITETDNVQASIPAHLVGFRVPTLNKTSFYYFCF